MNLVGLSYIYRKDYSGSERIFKEILQDYPDVQNPDYYSILIPMSQLNRDKYKEAKQNFEKFEEKYPKSRFLKLAQRGSQSTQNIMDFSPRRPWLAMSLSAVVPGTGQLYNREWSNAFVSFVFNLSLGFLAVNSFLKDDYVGGGIFSTLFVTFYAGNIYQARRSSVKYNETYRRDQIDAVNRTFEKYKFAEQE
jgi:tetratricopeptide (TPR) repeat protein